MGHIVPALTSKPLLSIGQFCNTGCHVAFTATTVDIHYQNQLKLQACTHHTHNSGRLTALTAYATNNAPMPVNHQARHHCRFGGICTCCIIQLRTLHHQHLSEIGSLTLAQLCCFPPISWAMHQGHLNQSQSNQCSTKPANDKQFVNQYPNMPKDDNKSHACFATFIEPSSQIHIDQTGKFPTPSSTSNNCIMVAYKYYRNAISLEPFKDCSTSNIVNAFKMLYACLCWVSLWPCLQHLNNKASAALNNEASAAFKDFLVANDIDYQLVPPYVHYHNAAECAICTFKNHFIASLCSTDADFPVTPIRLVDPTSQNFPKSSPQMHLQPQVVYLRIHPWPL